MATECTLTKTSGLALLHVTPDAKAAPRHNSDRAYRDLFEQLVIEAAWAWLRRSTAIDQPHYTAADIAEMERHIAASLKGLTTSIDLGWECCQAALARGDSGEQFTASVIAFHTHDARCIQIAVETGLTDPRTTKGLISALGWLQSEIARPWIERLLKGKDLNHKYLGIAACSIRREDPGELLTDILRREDCRQHAKLYARALRLAGEIRRRDLLPQLQASLGASEPALAFWANWSSILLGHRDLVKNLRPVVLKPGPYQSCAIQLAFRVLPIEQGREWISALAKDPSNLRTVIIATGILGDPHAVSWLINKMTDPKQARLAGEAFTFITGLDLNNAKLTLAPQQTPVLPDNLEGGDLGHDEDQNLPWPDAEKIATVWRRHGTNFKAGQRYFVGKTITPEWLKHQIAAGNMRHRNSAALDLTLIDPQSRFINTRAKLIH